MRLVGADSNVAASCCGLQRSSLCCLHVSSVEMGRAGTEKNCYEQDNIHLSKQGTVNRTGKFQHISIQL